MKCVKLRFLILNFTAFACNPLTLLIYETKILTLRVALYVQEINIASYYIMRTRLLGQKVQAPMKHTRQSECQKKYTTQRDTL